MAIDLVPIWTGILGLAVFMYVLLDGFDATRFRPSSLRSLSTLAGNRPAPSAAQLST